MAIVGLYASTSKKTGQKDVHPSKRRDATYFARRGIKATWVLERGGRSNGDQSQIEMT